MLPVTYALLAEMMPSKHRGWALVLVGGLGAVGGYFAASGFSAVLEPTYSWRILWLINLPTGLILIGLGGLIPESAKFLLARGRKAEAHAVMARFGTVSRKLPEGEEDAAEVMAHASNYAVEELASDGKLWTPQLIGKTAALTIAALAWGLINFGCSSGCLTIWWRKAIPWAYEQAPGRVRPDRFSDRLSLRLYLQPLEHEMGAHHHDRDHLPGLGRGPAPGNLHGPKPGLARRPADHRQQRHHRHLLPYTSESYPVKVRGRATGWVAACTKGGGVLAQTVSIAALVPPLGIAAAVIMFPVLVALWLFIRFGSETRGLDLRALERIAPENSRDADPA